jgi:ribosomal protein S4
MCFIISKIPQGKIMENGVLVENPQYEMQRQYIKEVEEAQRNPLSMGKHRKRAK